MYTTFSIRAPLGLHPDATYTFSFSLFPKSEGKDKNIYILDSGAEGFKVSASSGPSITNILPQTVHRANLLTTVFQIYGMDLDRLNKTYSPHILSTPMVYLNFLDIEKDHAKLKIIAVPVAGISPGNYMVEFMDKDSRPVFCRTKLTVIG